MRRPVASRPRVATRPAPLHAGRCLFVLSARRRHASRAPRARQAFAAREPRGCRKTVKSPFRIGAIWSQPSGGPRVGTRPQDLGWVVGVSRLEPPLICCSRRVGEFHAGMCFLPAATALLGRENGACVFLPAATALLARGK